MADLKRAFTSVLFARWMEYFDKPIKDKFQEYWDLAVKTRLKSCDEAINILFPQIKNELMRAWEKHGHLNSAHEGYAVLLEEMDELKEHVWMKQSERNMEEMGKEALQVAAMAMKFYVDIIVENNRR